MNEEITLFVDYRISEACTNWRSYGAVCVKCGRCGRTFSNVGIMEIFSPKAQADINRLLADEQEDEE